MSLHVHPSKYKIKRIYTPNTKTRGKKYLTRQEMEKLFENEVTIEEKLDGKLYIVNNDERYILIFEDLEKTHTIYYKNLPARRILLDVYDKLKGRYLDAEQKVIFALSEGFIPAPIIFYGYLENSIEDFIEELIFNSKSAFKTEINPQMKKLINDLPTNQNFIEGVVVKNYKNQIFGKSVNPLFEHIIDELGRYEKYDHYNKTLVYDIDSYRSYINKHIIEPLNISKKMKWDEQFYTQYLKKIYEI